MMVLALDRDPIIGAGDPGTRPAPFMSLLDPDLNQVPDPDLALGLDRDPLSGLDRDPVVLKVPPVVVLAHLQPAPVADLAQPRLERAVAQLPVVVAAKKLPQPRRKRRAHLRKGFLPASARGPT